MLDDRELLEYLGTRRWFGEKGRPVHGIELKDVIPVAFPGAKKTYVVARADVTTDVGVSTYQLFLIDGERHPTDALDEEEFRRGLADAFIGGAEFTSGSTRWVIAREGQRSLVVPASGPITLSSAEQSNSSVILNREAILKLYRKLDRGLHPDIEVTRFLTVDRDFVHTPVLLGTVLFEDNAGTTVAGMLQEYVRGAVDGWTYALDCSRPYFEADDDADPELPFQREAEQLGTVTRALHDTLASGDPGSDFDLRPASVSDARRWASAAARTIERALAALAQALVNKKLPREYRKEAEDIAARAPRLVATVNEHVAAIDTDAGASVRTHGDYHLGQVIRSETGQFLIIDFEGEPARPLSERRARHSPLRDVAGMLRSFAYAAAEGSRAADKRVGETRAARWEAGSRESFLRGYFSEHDENGALLPRSRSNVDRLLGLFEAEKIFYELQYELDHRPDWVWIPLRGVTKVFA